MSTTTMMRDTRQVDYRKLRKEDLINIIMSSSRAQPQFRVGDKVYIILCSGRKTYTDQYGIYTVDSYEPSQESVIEEVRVNTQDGNYIYFVSGKKDQCTEYRYADSVYGSRADAVAAITEKVQAELKSSRTSHLYAVATAQLKMGTLELPDENDALAHQVFSTVALDFCLTMSQQNFTERFELVAASMNTYQESLNNGEPNYARLYGTAQEARELLAYHNCRMELIKKFNLDLPTLDFPQGAEKVINAINANISLRSKFPLQSRHNF